MQRRAWPFASGGFVVLAAATLPLASLRLGFTDQGNDPKSTTTRKAYDLRTEGFGAGSNGKLQVVADLSQVPADQRQAALTALHDELAAYPGMDYVTQPQPSRDGAGALMTAVPTAGPNDQATKDLVRNARDAESAVRVVESDAALDDFYDSIFRTLVTYMVENPRTISQVAHLLFVAKNLERIGDHATNVAEMVYFAATGTQMADRDRGGAHEDKR